MSERDLASGAIRLFLHYPAGHCAYIVIVDEKRRPFDFTDDSFKFASTLEQPENACLYASGRQESRADHGYSYSVEFDLSRLLSGSDAERRPSEGTVVSFHWLTQLGDAPDVNSDSKHGSCRFRLVSGVFEPVDRHSADQLDENIPFERRAKAAEDYRNFVMSEMDDQAIRRRNLADAVKAGKVNQVLRVFAEDLVSWSYNLKRHFVHQAGHLAADPFFVRLRAVPKNATFRVYETWAVRDWIGGREAYEMLEFYKSKEFADSFSRRLQKLHDTRVAFCEDVIDYTVQTLGEDVEGMLALDEARKELKHRALDFVDYVDVIAQQFEATELAAQRPPLEPAYGDVVSTQVGEKNDAQRISAMEIVFFEDRVEFCGADICSGPRSVSRRVVLELLSRRRPDGSFLAYSGDDLESQARRLGAKGTANGWIRDLRDDIYSVLRATADNPPRREQLILSGGPGYRFSDSLKVRCVTTKSITDITDIGEQVDVRNDDVLDVSNVHDDVLDDRSDWILRQLAEGRRLKAPDVAEHFGCSVKTAQRDLTELRTAGKVEFVGARRTGFYRLIPKN